MSRRQSLRKTLCHPVPAWQELHTDNEPRLERGHCVERILERCRGAWDVCVVYMCVCVCVCVCVCECECECERERERVREQARERESESVCVCVCVCVSVCFEPGETGAVSSLCTV